LQAAADIGQIDRTLRTLVAHRLQL
jgi:hypothetical protein